MDRQNELVRARDALVHVPEKNPRLVPVSQHRVALASEPITKIIHDRGGEGARVADNKDLRIVLVGFLGKPARKEWNTLLKIVRLHLQLREKAVIAASSEVVINPPDIGIEPLCVECGESVPGKVQAVPHGFV